MAKKTNTEFNARPYMELAIAEMKIIESKKTKRV
jgi:hypothetical protein